MSKYLGDYAEDATLYTKFLTIDSTGAPTTLSGSPDFRVYKDDSTTQTDSGITLIADFDSITGLNHITIDLSSSVFYETGADYQIVMDAGTVDGTSIVGYVIADFSIENRFNEANVTQWNGTAVATPATAGYPAVTLKVGTGTGEVNLSSGKAPATIAAGDLATDSLTADALAADAIAEIADQVWDEVASGHVTAGTFGKLLDTIESKTSLITSTGVVTTIGLISDGDTFEVTRGKALTGIELTVPTSTIDLSGYNATFGVTRIATDNAVTSDTAAEQFNFTITDPGGAGQKITGSIPKTSTANWTLDNDMVVETFTPTGRAYRWSIDINNSHTGTAQAGASSTITLAADASDDDDFYNGVTVEITGGTGSGQTKTITDYVGSTRVATVDSSWASNPDNTSVYHVAASDTGCVPLAKGEISVTAADTNCGQPS